MHQMVEMNGKLICEISIMRCRLDGKNDQLLQIYEKCYLEKLKNEKLRQKLLERDSKIAKLTEEIEQMKGAEFCDDLIAL